jgi:uncharacterized cysteine cluster protein YcgN (CxxCxxCC family)
MIDYEGKKLYVVTVEYQAYVLAEAYEDAQDFASEIVENEEPFVDCVQVADDNPNPLKWVSHACIYHPEQDQRDIDLWKVIGV